MRVVHDTITPNATVLALDTIATGIRLPEYSPECYASGWEGCVHFQRSHYPRTITVKKNIPEEPEPKYPPRSEKGITRRNRRGKKKRRRRLDHIAHVCRRHHTGH